MPSEPEPVAAGGEDEDDTSKLLASSAIETYVVCLDVAPAYNSTPIVGLRKRPLAIKVFGPVNKDANSEERCGTVDSTVARPSCVFRPGTRGAHATFPFVRSLVENRQERAESLYPSAH